MAEVYNMWKLAEHPFLGQGEGRTGNHLVRACMLSCSVVSDSFRHYGQ